MTPVKPMQALRDAVLTAVRAHPDGLTLDGIRRVAKGRCDMLSLCGLVSAMTAQGYLLRRGRHQPYQYVSPTTFGDMAHLPAPAGLTPSAFGVSNVGLICGARAAA